jgi:protein TonB
MRFFNLSSAKVVLFLIIVYASENKLLPLWVININNAHGRRFIIKRVGYIKVTDSNAYITPHKYQRATGFLLGLIIVLACLFAAFEYTSAGDNTTDEQVLDDISKDLEMMSAQDTKDMVSAAVPAMGQRSSSSEKMRIVNNTQSSLQPTFSTGSSNNSDGSTNSPFVIGNGEAETDNANVSKAIPQTSAQTEAPVDFRIIEQLPEFPGGIVEFMKWLTANLHYPVNAQQQKIMGKVVVSFIINKDGSISNASVDKSVSPELDREAIRVIRMMPRWKPGIQNDKPCRTMFAIPIIFQI